MARKKQASFKMKGHTLPGVNQKSETANLKDGRSPSSAFQMNVANPNVMETEENETVDAGKKLLKEEAMKEMEGDSAIAMKSPNNDLFSNLICLLLSCILSSYSLFDMLEALSVSELTSTLCE